MAAPELKRQQWGVTPPVSTDPPPEGSEAQREKLLECLNRDAPSETPEGMKNRYQVMELLGKIVGDWCYEVGVTSAGLDEETARAASAKIFLHGSSKLGVLTPGSDIDCVCVVPKHVTRDHFFQLLPGKLMEHRLDITKINLVAEAHTPVIEMEIRGQAVDLGFARLNLPTLKGVDSLLDDNLLIAIDEKSARGINGCRVNELILKLVPSEKVFREALRFIKHWTKTRGVSSNMLGFFGGIQCAILVARVCQLYPNYNSPMIIMRFFTLYRQWQWGPDKPVVLTAVKQPTNTNLLTHRVWDPRQHAHDRQHVMPIITPAFPCMNSTHNVSDSTKKVIVREFEVAEEMVRRVLKGQAEWTDVYQRINFFGQHYHFLRIMIVAKSQALMDQWEGFVNSKVRRVVTNLEQYNSNISVRPLPDLLELGPDLTDLMRDWPHGKQMFIGLSFPKTSFSETDELVLHQPVERFNEFIVSLWQQDNAKNPDAPQNGQHVDMSVTYIPQERLPKEFRPAKAGGWANAKKRTREDEILDEKVGQGAVKDTEGEERLKKIIGEGEKAPAKRQRKNIAVDVTNY